MTEEPFVVLGLWHFYIVFGAWLLGSFSVYSYLMPRHLYLPLPEQGPTFGRTAGFG